MQDLSEYDYYLTINTLPSSQVSKRLSIIYIYRLSRMEGNGRAGRSKLMVIYQLFFSLGCFLFTLATLATVPSSDQLIFNPLFKILLKLSAVCLIIAQTCELVTKSVDHFKFVILAFAVAGYIGLIKATMIYQSFNKGELYLIAAFSISLAYQLKILSIVLKAHDYDDIKVKYFNRFIRFVVITVGSIFFLVGSLMLVAEYDQNVCKIMTVVGGVFFSMPIVIGYQKNEKKGYVWFNHSIELNYSMEQMPRA